MPSLLVRQNLSVPDLQTYYNSLWSDGDQVSFSSSQARGWLTDLELVGRDEVGWGSVKVHKAVILPLCPYLSKLSKVIEGIEDPQIIFSDVPVEVIQSVVQLLYTGQCTLSPVANLKGILDFMSSLGLKIPADRLQVDIAGAEKVEINHHTVTGGKHDESEIERKEILLNDTIEHVVERAKVFAAEQIQKDSTTLDANCNSVKRIVKNKSTESRFFCEYCKFECRFWIQLAEHSNSDHAKELFSCKKCDFKTSKLMNLKNHEKQVHIGKGSYICNICGVKALNPQKLAWHQKYKHKMVDHSSIKEKQSVKVMRKASKPILTEAPRKSLRDKNAVQVDMLHCSECQFRSFSKKSLRKHFKRFHGNP